MLSGKARPQFDDFAAKVRSWEAIVPLRARRFHAARGKLETEIGEVLPRWRPWIDDEIVERYRSRVGRLEEVAEPLAELIRDAERLEAEVSELDRRAGGGEAELAAWFDGRCREWLAILGRIGANCERTADVYRDHSALGPIESDVRRHEEALQQLREATQIVTVLRSNIQAATLIALLPQLHQRLYAQGATPEWLKEIRELLQPLKVIRDRVTDPPPELYEVGENLRDARGWSKFLGGELADEIQRLAELHQFKAIDWEGEPIDELAAEAAALRQRLFDRAQELRNAKLLDLENAMDDLRQACGYQQTLQKKLAALQERTFDHPEAFHDWLRSVDQFQQSFKAITHTEIGKIEQRLREATAVLRAKVAELQSRPLSEEVDRELTLLERDVRQLPDPSDADAEAMLRGLREAKEIARKMEQLAFRAEQEYRDLDEQQRLLAARSEALQTEAQRVKRVIDIDLADLPQRIAALSQAGGSLVERRRCVRELAAELDDLEMAFIERCRRPLSRQLDTVRRAVEVLQAAGVAAAAGESPQIPSGAQPRAAAQAVIDAARRVRLLLRKARETLKEFAARAGQVRSELARLRPDELTPGDRQTAELAAQELDRALAGIDGSALLDALARLAAQVNASDRFFAQLRQEETRARERLSNLRGHLQKLHEEQLDRFCPELTELVAALLYGVPERPRQWSAVHHQLNVAGDLFGRIALYARRLAAEELGRAEETLRKALRGASDPSFRASAEALLAELDACGNEELPCVSLRRRIVSASQRRT